MNNQDNDNQSCSSKPEPDNERNSTNVYTSKRETRPGRSFRPNNVMPSLPEYSSQAEVESSDSNSSELEANEQRERAPECYIIENELIDDDDDYDQEDEDEDEGKDEEADRVDETCPNEEGENDNGNDELDDDEGNNYGVTRPLKKDSGDSSGIASNSNSDQTIETSPVIVKKPDKTKKKIKIRDSSLVY